MAQIETYGKRRALPRKAKCVKDASYWETDALLLRQVQKSMRSRACHRQTIEYCKSFLAA